MKRADKAHHDIHQSLVSKIVANRCDHGQLGRQTAAEEPFEFGHSLEDQIGGQIAAGFVITGFYEDVFPPEKDVLSRYIPSFAATRATKTAR